MWRPLLLKPIQEPEPLSSARKKERWQKKKSIRPFSADCKNIRRDRTSAFARRGARRVSLHCSARWR